MNWKHYRIYFLACLLTTFGLQAQEEYPGLEDFLHSKLLQDVQLSVLAQEIGSGDTLCAYSEHSALIPASNVKLFSSALAWSVLGPKHTLKTRFYWDGYMSEDRILEGDLIVEGEGDPTLGSEKWKRRDIYSLFDELVIQLNTNGIDSILGDLVIAAYPFEGRWHHDNWLWADLGNYYGISSGAVNFNENSYELTFNTSGPVGSSAEVVSLQPDPGLDFDNQVRIGPPNSGDQAYIYGDAHDRKRVIRGSVPKDGMSFKIKGSLPDPEVFFANVLQRHLKEKGIGIRGSVRIDRSPDLNKKALLLTIASPPMEEIINYVNKNSHNLFAEAIYKSVSVRYPSKMKLQLSKWRNAGIDFHSIRWKDGSGLSPYNRFSANDFVLLLKQMEMEENYLNTLAIPGDDGTLQYRFLSLRDNLRAKTGSIEGVYALSGILTKNNKRIIFSILVNNYYGSNRSLDQELEKLFETWLGQ